MQIPAMPYNFFGKGAKQVFAIQARLTQLGFEPGPLDGYWGNLTQGAWEEFQAMRDAKSEVVAHGQLRLFTDAEAVEIFGLPGPELESRLTMITLPYPMRLEWLPSVQVRWMRAHPYIASQLEAALTLVAEIYTSSEIERLKLDLFSGLYNHRKMRQYRRWSRHAFGIAIDINAGENGLRTRWEDAAFSRPEYGPFLEAFRDHGFLNLGQVVGVDAMHFEYAVAVTD